MQRKILALLVSSLAATPALAGRAVDLGATQPNRPMQITVWLNMHDADGLTAKVQAMHDRTSPSFQQFESAAAINAQHAPTAAEAASVASFLKSQGLTVTATGPNNLFVRASGSAAQISSAFKVPLHDFRLAGQTYQGSTGKASVPRAMQGVIGHVSMNNFGARPMVAKLPDSKPMPLSSAVANPNGLVFSAGCFRSPQTVSFSSSDGTTTAKYFGNRYGADITNSAEGTLPPCGYQPSEIQKAYSLNQLYSQHLDGTGQTVAIVDAYGSTTIAQDAAAFSAIMGLPPVNLTIIGTPTESNFSPDANAGWAGETTLDVEWVHSVAPGAKIVLVVTPTNSFDDLFAGIATAASIPGVSSISNSWSGFDIGVDGDSEFFVPIDNFFKSISAQGIGVQFSTGDDGNNADQLGGTYTTAGWPGSSPFVTGIGGVSMGLDKKGNIALQTSWGTNLTEIADTAALGNPPLDPPNNEGFIFGGGGGLSDTYPQPWFQRGLPYSRRATPDISWLADPYTGVEIIYTGDSQGDLEISVIGGTSLACPMFSALWAITTQAAGHKLGQAAPYLYDLDGGAITDITTVSSFANVAGIVTDSGGSSIETSDQLAAPLQNLPGYYSALYNSPNSTRWFVITFGLDSTLGASWGYDLSTGLGAPNPPAFVKALSRSHR